MTFFSKFFRSLTTSAVPTGPRGYRAYAIGDVHGRLDLLDELIGKIEQDIAARPASRNLIVMLGDLIDRGPESAGVVERLRTWRMANVRPVFLSGNHEEVLLRVLDGEHALIADWLKFGGGECCASYGLDPASLEGLDEREAQAAIVSVIPQTHRDFLASFSDTFRFGDYLFVHAGIRPGLEIADQAQEDLRWIRDPFLSDTHDHGFVVVHGHTISKQVDERFNRIGLDTGAYRTGILSALAVEGVERWYLDTSPAYRP